MVQERDYQGSLIKKLHRLFPGCVVLKNDSSYLQGVCDLLVLYRSKWAMLEVKKSANEETQPNQLYYVDLFDTMSFGAIIYPENEKDILSDLQRTFRAEGTACVSQR